MKTPMKTKSFYELEIIAPGPVTKRELEAIERQIMAGLGYAGIEVTSVKVRAWPAQVDLRLIKAKPRSKVKLRSRK